MARTSASSIRTGIVLIASSVLVTGCNQSSSTGTPPAATVAQKNDGSNIDNPMTKTNGESPATDASTDGELSLPDFATEVQLSVVDGAGYRAIREKHLGKVILVDYWATW